MHARGVLWRTRFGSKSVRASDSGIAKYKTPTKMIIGRYQERRGGTEFWREHAVVMARREPALQREPAGSTQARDAGEAVQSSVEGEDAIGMPVLHHREVDRVARRDPG